MVRIVLYISDIRENLLDDIVNKHFLMMDKIRANNLNNFVIGNGKSLTHATHLVIDLTALNDTHDEIISSINMLKKLYFTMKIVVIADSDKISMDLLRRIYDKGIYDIVKDISGGELEKCMIQGKTAEEAKDFFVERPNLSTEEGQNAINKRMVEEQAKLIEQKPEVQEPPPQKIEKILPNKEFRKYKSYISIAICGSEPHIGVTHHALLITKFLSNIGFKACYLEANDSQKIFYLKSYYPQNSNFSPRKSLLQCFGVDMYSGFQISNVMAENYDIYVFDLGVLTSEKLTSFLTKDVRIVVGGARAWELNTLRTAIELIGVKNEVNFLLNYAIYGEETKLFDFMDILKHKTFIAEYTPNPFQEGVNIEAYKKLFSDYIIQEEKPVKEPKKKGIFRFM